MHGADGPGDAAPEALLGLCSKVCYEGSLQPKHGILSGCFHKLGLQCVGVLT